MKATLDYGEGLNIHLLYGLKKKVWHYFQLMPKRIKLSELSCSWLTTCLKRHQFYVGNHTMNLWFSLASHTKRFWEKQGFLASKMMRVLLLVSADCKSNLQWGNTCFCKGRQTVSERGRVIIEMSISNLSGSRPWFARPFKMNANAVWVSGKFQTPDFLENCQL